MISVSRRFPSRGRSSVSWTTVSSFWTRQCRTCEFSRTASCARCRAVQPRGPRARARRIGSFESGPSPSREGCHPPRPALPPSRGPTRKRTLRVRPPFRATGEPHARARCAAPGCCPARYAREASRSAAGVSRIGSRSRARAISARKYSASGVRSSGRSRRGGISSMTVLMRK